MKISEYIGGKRYPGRGWHINKIMQRIEFEKYLKHAF
jgi:hypothetical protein